MKDKQLKKFISILPQVILIKLRDEVDYYGVTYYLAKKIGLSYLPRSMASWRHGWLYFDLKFIEQVVINHRSLFYLVALQEHEEFLISKGIKSISVGMPFMYISNLDNMHVERMKNSLLVIPPHSLPYTSHNWNEFDYAAQIADLKDHFDLIVVCIHSACVDNGYWVEAFEKYNIPWIIGANVFDKNALIRMSRIFKSFEFMTTNTIGSHVLYAAYSGCKVSIYGKFAEYSEEDFLNDPYYSVNPLILKENLLGSTEKKIREKYNCFFVHPKKAVQKLIWAKEQIGEKNKKTIDDLADLLGWNTKGQIFLYCYFFFSKLIRISKRLLKRILSFSGLACVG